MTSSDLKKRFNESSSPRPRNRRPVDVSVSRPVFEINTAWHPDYCDEVWKRYTSLKDYAKEFDVGVNEINDMFEAGAIRLIEVG